MVSFAMALEYFLNLKWMMWFTLCNFLLFIFFILLNHLNDLFVAHICNIAEERPIP